MISCETGKVKITGKIDEIKEEATVLMNAMYGTICKEEGEQSADNFFDKLTKRAKMSKLGLISDVLGCIGECAGGFEKDKKYIFDKDTYIKDMESSDGFDDENLGFASDCDGKEVKVITCGLGIVEDKYPVHPDWCKEVEEEEIIKDMFEPGKKYVFDAELCRKDGYCFKDNGWINEIDGMEVRVITPILGRAKFYAIAPTWCREVE